MSSLKGIIFISICLGGFLNILAANETIDCSNQELVTSIFNDPIELTLNGTIRIFENVSINEILSTTNNEFELKYIEARLQSRDGGGGASAAGNATKNLIIFTTEHFHNYARDQTAARISLKINLGCGAGKERIIVFFQPLKEGNYYGPVFSQPLYELMMPTPIFAGFDLTSLIEISAKDDDLTHNQINFTSTSLSEHYISVGTKNVSSSDKKTYLANLTLDRIYLELPQQIEFVIIATDNGIPPRSSNATVIIRSDTSRSLPVLPRFTEKLYKGIIKVDFTMEPSTLHLIEGTYAPEINFTLNGDEIRGFELQDKRDGSIEIKWNASNVNQSFIMQHKIWELEVKVEHSKLVEFSTVTVIVELTDFQKYFHFISTYYDGLITEQIQLELTPIILYPIIYRPEIEFTFLENPQNMFSVANNAFQVQVQLRSNFTLDAFTNDTFIKLTLQASWEQLTAVTYAIIKLPQRPANNTTTTTGHQQQMFQFQKPLYVGNITAATKGVDMESIVLQTDAQTTQLKEVQFQLNGELSQLFRLVINDTVVKLEVNSTEVVAYINSPIVLVLQAIKDDLTAFASIVLTSPQIALTGSNAANVFVAHSLIGKLLINNNSQNLSLDSIELRSMENLTDYEFNIEGDVASNFELKINITALKMDLVLRAPLSNATLEMKKILVLSIQAKRSRFANVMDNLMVFIELPMNECPKSLAPLRNPPTFSSRNFVFTTFTNTTGSLGVVRVYSTGPMAIFHYFLEVENDTLAQRLSIEPFTGELMLYGSIDIGNYGFNITAENIESKERAHAQALLKVTDKEECRIYEGISVEKTLVIKHINEEMPYHGLWNMTFNENCTFHIMEMWPKDKEYAYVNESSHMLDILAVDREDLIFEHMSETQILVKLKLTCSILEQRGEITTTQISRSLDLPDMIYTEDLLYAPDTMWLHLIVDDINDNAPQFTFKDGPLYLGYPAGKVALEIYPEYLTKIEATDRDLGENAKIRFSMRDNEYFSIDAETGKIYPKGRVLQSQQQTELIVLATDQDGKGLITGTVVIVKGLSPGFYSLLTLKENSTKSLEKVMQELRVETGYDVKIIKMSYIPQMEIRLAADSQGLVCKAWVYAYRDQQLVECKELQEKLLDKSPDASIVNIESYEEAGLPSNIIQNPPSTVGYIVAVVLLSLLSASSIIFIIWRFYYYGQSPFPNDTKCRSSTQHHQQSHGVNGQSNSRECSHGIAANSGDCTVCYNYSTNHVKFSSFVDNQVVD